MDMRREIRGLGGKVLLAAGLLLAASAASAGSAGPFLGGWDLTLPNGGAGWLGITEKDGKLQGELLWGGGSVLPVATVKVDGDQLVVTKTRDGQRKDKDGKVTKFTVTQTITGKLAGDTLKLTTVNAPNGKPEEFAGKRTPPLPPKPDLAKVKFGPPVKLFNGTDLSGWKVTNNNPSAWVAENGILANKAVQEPGKHKAYANLRTEQEFHDFRLTLEVRVPQGGNSGVYLRGIYEIQVADTFGKPLDPHNMGGLYSRICPTVAAEKPAGQWETMDITLVDRHVTVILNGTKIIDNQPVLGCTGGALWSDQLRPGPLYLQGDHTAVEYRNIVLYPVVK